MSRLRLVLRSLWFYRRNHASVLVGVVLASAVLTGALVMGDSVDQSLRNIALARLGNIDYACYAPGRYVAASLADALRGETHSPVAGVLHVRGMAIRRAAEAENVQVNQVEVHGIDAHFGPLAGAGEVAPGENEVLLNEKLAAALGVEKGDEVSLRITRPSLVALDAPLSPQGDDDSVRVRAAVKAVLPDAGAGRFSLTANQIAPYNAFINLSWLQELTGMPGLVNIVLAGSGIDGKGLASAVRKTWRLEHAGLRLREHASGLVQLESDRVFLDKAVAEAALAVPGARGTLAYLVNFIRKGEASTPYSFAVAGPVAETLGDDEAVVNAWLAEKLGLEAGDLMDVAYYEVMPSNAFVERKRTFKVAAIRSMEEMALERDLVPDFPGLSDVESCADWDIGMPMDEEALRDKDNEAYWDEYHQTPKLLVTLAAGQAMWGNRFGQYTAVRFEHGAQRRDAIAEAIRQAILPEDIGLGFAPVRAQALKAVNQAMDFGGLFLGMSFFLIAAALLLTALLFIFGVQQRSAELGTLLVAGFPAGAIRKLILAEAALVALAGSHAGASAGTVYARLLILGLSRFWSGAVAGTAIEYHAQPTTLGWGAAISFLCAICAIALAVWRQTRKPASLLLTADFSQMAADAKAGHTAYRTLFALSGCGATLGVAGAAYVLVTSPANIALPFFGIGALLLVSGLGFWGGLLILLGAGHSSSHLNLRRLAIHQVARRPGRSMAVAGFLACGVFLVLSVASMREDLESHAKERWSGTGGFELFAQATAPVQTPLTEALGKEGVSVVALRVRDGDDASCLNLNYSQTPRLLGVDPTALAVLGAFSKGSGDDSIWSALGLDLPGGVIPALVGDSDTAMWGLKAKTGEEDGDERVYRDESGREVKVRFAGSLPMRLSVFQGSLLISEEHFTQLYPSEGGFRMFLIDTPEGEEDAVAAALRKAFERSGMDVVPSVQRLREFYTVESTYLVMFLVLGGLGVGLGGVGMAVVVLRNLLERRGELAMLDAVGYDKRAVLQVLLLEHGALLLAGIGIGAAAAIVSMAPSVVSSGTHVPIALEAAVLVLVSLTGAACMGLAIFAGRPKDSLAALRNE